jgi:hypothetical protein
MGRMVGGILAPLHEQRSAYNPRKGSVHLRSIKQWREKSGLVVRRSSIKSKGCPFSIPS